MKQVFLFLLVTFTTQTLVAQVTLSQKVAGKGMQGKSRLIRQADGKLIYVTSTGGNFYSGRVFANGDNDDAFSGVRTSKIKLKDLIYCKTQSAELDKWSRFIIAGSSCVDSNSARIATMTRLTKNGDLDAEFQPRVIQLKVGDSSEFNSVYLQADEKIVGVGSCFSDGAYHFFLAQFIYNGEKDASFGTNGIRIDNTIAGSSKVAAAAVQSDGKIVVAGCNNNAGARNVILTRYNADGLMDTTFGNQGTAITEAQPNDYFIAKKMLLQPDGKILVCGMCAGENDGQDMFLMRYTVNGAIDTSFNKSGLVKADVTFEDRVDEFALSPDNTLLISGAGSMKGERKANRYIMLRFSPAGKIDNNFGYGSPKGLGAYVVKRGYTALSHNIAVSSRDSRIYRLSELVSDNETEVILALTTFLHDTSLSIIDIPDRKFQRMIFPQPIIKAVTFSFDLIDDQKMTIKLLDATGKELTTLINGALFKEGENTFTLNFPSSTKPENYDVVITTEEGYKAVIEVAKL